MEQLEMLSVAGSWEWSGAELNCRHVDFQSTALPTELPDQLNYLISRCWVGHVAC